MTYQNQYAEFMRDKQMIRKSAGQPAALNPAQITLRLKHIYTLLNISATDTPTKHAKKLIELLIFDVQTSPIKTGLNRGNTKKT
jgi:hypothetical protein